MTGGMLPASRWQPAATVGDLWWWSTPVTCHQARQAGLDTEPGDADLPVTGLTRAQAAEVAGALGARLPTVAEWQWMAYPDMRRYPWGDTEPTAAHANLRGLGPGRPTPVGGRPAGATRDGLLDVAGNVWEWTATSLPGRGAVVCGGSYHSLALYARRGFTNDIPADIRSPGIGLRVVRNP